MTAITMKHFDVLDCVKKFKELGIKEEVAECQARQLETAIDVAVSTMRKEIHTKDLATKNDLKLEVDSVKKEVECVKKDLEKNIESTKSQIILWVVGWTSGLFVASGLMQHLLK